MVIDFVICWLDNILVQVDVLCVWFWIFGLLVVDDDGVLVGIIINCDMWFEVDQFKQVVEVMIKVLLIIV